MNMTDENENENEGLDEEHTVTEWIPKRSESMRFYRTNIPEPRDNSHE